MQHLDQFRKCDYRIDGYCCDSRFEEGICPFNSISRGATRTVVVPTISDLG
jgi:hypothetical protein